MIRIRISDPRSLGSWCIKGTDESVTRVDSSVPLITRIRIWITQKERTHNLACWSDARFNFDSGVIFQSQFFASYSNQWDYLLHFVDNRFRQTDFFCVRQTGKRLAFVERFWNEKSFDCSSLFCYCIKQIDSLLPCVCSVIDHRRRQNVVRISVTHSAIASCETFLFLPHFDVICDWLLNRRMATWNLFIK